MKFLAATTVLSLLAAAGTSEAANSHNGVRRSVDFAPVGAGLQQRHATSTLQKRMPLGGLPADQPKMMKSLKRASVDYEKRDLDAHAGFGSMPILENRGMSSIMGLTERTIEHVKRAWSHDGKQGSSKEVQASADSSDSSSSSGSNDTSSSDGDDEECEEEDDTEDDDEECEEDDEEDDEEDCDEEDDSSDDSTASSTSSSSDSAATSSSDSADSAVNSVVQNAAAIVKPSATSSSSSSAASSTDSSDTPASGSKNTGIATWFTQNGNAGNCGKVNPDSAKIVALYSGVYDNGNNCGRKIMIKNLQDGTSVEASISDSCPSCGGPEDIDLSVGAMSALDPNYKTNGIRKVEWYYID